MLKFQTNPVILINNTAMKKISLLLTMILAGCDIVAPLPTDATLLRDKEGCAYLARDSVCAGSMQLVLIAEMSEPTCSFLEQRPKS